MSIISLTVSNFCFTDSVIRIRLSLYRSAKDNRMFGMSPMVNTCSRDKGEREHRWKERTSVVVAGLGFTFITALKMIPSFQNIKRVNLLNQIKAGFQRQIRNLGVLVNFSLKQTCDQRCMVGERHCSNDSTNYICSSCKEEKFTEMFHECWCITHWPTLLPLTAPGSPICSRSLVTRAPWCLPHAHPHLCHR